MDNFEKMQRFIRCWFKSTSLKQVAVLTEMDEQECRNASVNLRRRGVFLKKMIPRRQPTGSESLSSDDVRKLVSLSKRLSKSTKHTSR